MKTESKKFRSLCYNIYKKWYGSEGVREFVNNKHNEHAQIQDYNDNYTGEELLPEHARSFNNQNSTSNPVLDYFTFNRKKYFLIAQM